jgi:anti-anti-sigma factor
MKPGYTNNRMEISKRQTGDYGEINLQGRLDGYWSDHLARTLEETVRDGVHHIRLDLSAVDYISSLGIGVLMRSHKELSAIGGSLKVFNPSEQVREVITLSGLAGILLSRGTSQFDKRATDAGKTWELPPRGIERQLERGTFEFFEQGPATGMECRPFGDPGPLRGCRFGESACRALAIPETGFALGLGALGQRFADCSDRFGEFLAVAGAAAYLPTDGTNVPDYLMLRGDTPPSVQACYGLVCTGQLGRLARFEAKTGGGAMSLSDIVETALAWSSSNGIGMVVAAESVGLIGAALRRSPAANAAPEAPFVHPEIRSWLTFTAERAFPRCVALIAGVAMHDPSAALAPFVRPFGKDASLLGHFHAAAFSYRSLPKGPVRLADVVAALFESQRLQGLLHLLADHREQTGLGESEFMRGACWFAPIDSVVPLPE